MTHLFLLTGDDIIAFLPNSILSTLFEDPVCKGLIRGVCRGDVTMTVLFLKLDQFLEPRFPRRSTNTHRPLEVKFIQTVNPILG